MALDPTPWGIGGGAVHQPETVRQATHDSTSGSEGISSPTALRVAPTSVPGGNVRVLPGGALILNGYEGGAGQTYSARNMSQTEVPISPTGSGAGRTDLLVLRILDPQYEGEPPADPTVFDYVRFEVIEGVPAQTETFAELNLNYPAIELAKVTLPKSTATVTAAMIEDLREVAQPREQTVIRPRAMIDKDTEDLTATAVKGEGYPNVGRQIIDVPEWATRVQIRADWGGVKLWPDSGWGTIWVGFGPYVDGVYAHQTQNFQWNSDDTAEFNRTNWFVADDIQVPMALKGTSVQFAMMARNAAPGSRNVQMDASSGVILQVRFLEVADPSTT